MKYIFTGILFYFALFCSAQEIKVGASCTDEYLPLLKGKTICVVANHTSMIGNESLVDTLLSLGIKIKCVFSPEHGFRGKGDAGEHIADYIDDETKLPVISLYGDNVKPKPDVLKGVAIIVFDMQDVGVRYYTYISTLHYVMEACAENNIQLIVLDRPNPNGYYIDGPTLQPQYKSFVGMHPVPLVHGMTIGEYAQMINGEGWLANHEKCNLTIIACKGYTHTTRFVPKIKPSPNLPTIRAIELYPTLGLFEGTVMSCGRGTDFPFQVIGHPNYTTKTFSFTPRSIEGASKNPPLLGKKCYGIDFRSADSEVPFVEGTLNIGILIYAYHHTAMKGKPFFVSFINRLAGTDELQKQIINNVSEDKIRESWQPDLEKFKLIRKKYLLYKDFY